MRCTFHSTTVTGGARLAGPMTILGGITERLDDLSLPVPITTPQISKAALNVLDSYLLAVDP